MVVIVYQVIFTCFLVKMSNRSKINTDLVENNHILSNFYFVNHLLKIKITLEQKGQKSSPYV